MKLNQVECNAQYCKQHRSQTWTTATSCVAGMECGWRATDMTLKELHLPPVRGKVTSSTSSCSSYIQWCVLLMSGQHARGYYHTGSDPEHQQAMTPQAQPLCHGRCAVRPPTCSQGHRQQPRPIDTRDTHQRRHSMQVVAAGRHCRYWTQQFDASKEKRMYMHWRAPRGLHTIKRSMAWQVL